MSSVLVMLNFLGAPVNTKYIAVMRDGKDHTGDFEYRMIKHVLDIPPEHVGADVLDRYVEVSGKEPYAAVLPHTDEIFARLLLPLKSAKRLYCLGEYIATIELCAHVGEMLALLVWDITPKTLKDSAIDEGLEKKLWGSTFEKLGQEKRIDILSAFGMLQDDDIQKLDHLRSVRRQYFHLWNRPNERPQEDAMGCFLRLMTLVKNILKIEVNEGKVAVNPLLSAYLARHDVAS